MRQQPLSPSHQIMSLHTYEFRNQVRLRDMTTRWHSGVWKTLRIDNVMKCDTMQCNVFVYNDPVPKVLFLSYRNIAWESMFYTYILIILYTNVWILLELERYSLHMSLQLLGDPIGIVVIRVVRYFKTLLWRFLSIEWMTMFNKLILTAHLWKECRH